MRILKDRLLDFISYLDIEVAVFEKEAGLSNGFVNKLGDNPRSTSLDRISLRYPELNMNWLKQEKGEMIIKNIVPSPKTEYGICDELEKNGDIPIRYLMNIINRTTESNYLNAKANEINAKANEINALANKERVESERINNENIKAMLELMKDIKQSQTDLKGAEIVEQKGNIDAATTA